MGSSQFHSARGRCSLRACSATLLLLGGAACAGPGEARRQAPPTQERAAPERGRGEQVASLFIGGVVDADERDGYTLGAEYEYRLSESLGVGGFAESVAEIERTFAAGALLYGHPLGDWVLLTGPGYQRSEGEWSSILRVGVGYEFEVSEDLRLTPELCYDFSEGEDVLVFGFNLGLSL